LYICGIDNWACCLIFLYRKKISMQESIINSLILFVLFMSIVNVIKEVFLFTSAVVNRVKLETTSLRQWLLAGSIAYICTVIFS
jgi:hypothetical protein